MSEQIFFIVDCIYLAFLHFLLPLIVHPLLPPESADPPQPSSGPSDPHHIIIMEAANSYVLIHGKNISQNTLAGSAAGPHMSIDKLFPALLECFGIILCGYIAGR